MDVHHLNCVTMHPPGKRLLQGEGGWLEPAEVVCHCLLLEVNDELLLVDTGISVKDMENLNRLGYGFKMMMSPEPDPSQPAVVQIRELGLDPADVSHIFITHLDVDHAGGLVDFPDAKVHLLEDEFGVSHSPPLTEALRYQSIQWAHDPDWVKHDPESGSTDWFGFDSVRPLPSDYPDIRMVSLPGHSAGHAGVAIPLKEGWLLHCGDAYFDTQEMDVENPSCSPGYRLFQSLIAHENDRRLETQQRLLELNRSREEVRLICSHSPEEFARSRELEREIDSA